MKLLFYAKQKVAF